MARDFDIILFGATGFTGKHAVPLISKFSKTQNRHLTWGIAGRSEQKLKALLEECAKETGTPLGDVPIIIADIKDENSLHEMAKKARIIINCCGPYRFYGEPVVKACVEEGTHHVDVSGEPQYMEGMQLKYDAQAKEKGVYIISACGFDSIPTDLGIVFMQRKFDGVLNSVVSYLSAWQEGEDVAGPAINYGTWESAVNGLAHGNELGPLRKKLFPTRLPSFKPKLGAKPYPHKSKLVEGWVLPFLGADRSVVKRSQRLFYEKDQKRPLQIETYFTLKSIFSVFMLMIFGLIFKILAKFSFGRSLLLNNPEIFSGGFFSRDPPSEEKIEKARFSVVLYGEGWKDRLADVNDQYPVPPNKAISAKVTGRNPGYGATCVCLVLAGITVITEPEKLPPGGGVYPPGYAFANTTLVEQLNANDVTFEVVFEKDLPAAK